MFLVARPALIIFYSVFVTCVETHKTCVRRRKFIHQKKLDEQNFTFAEEIGKTKGIKRAGLKYSSKAGIRSNTDGSDGGGVDGEPNEKMQAQAQTQKQQNIDGDMADIMPNEDDKLEVPENLAHILHDSDDEDENEKTTDLTKNYLKEI